MTVSCRWAYYIVTASAMVLWHDKASTYVFKIQLNYCTWEIQ